MVKLINFLMLLLIAILLVLGIYLFNLEKEKEELCQEYEMEYIFEHVNKHYCLDFKHHDFYIIEKGEQGYYVNLEGP